MRRKQEPMIQCNQCGTSLSEEFGDLPRLPCPECGATARGFSMTAGSGNFKIVGGNVSLIHGRPGLSSGAQRDDQGRIVLSIKGPSPKNEEDVLDLCARLVRLLNISGGTWSVPVIGEQEVDA